MQLQNEETLMKSFAMTL